MSTVITLPARNHFGDCPKCRRNNGYLNIGREHWFICKKHGVKWFVGSNIFPSWRQETEKIWSQNNMLLENFMEVEPVKRWELAELSHIYFGSNQKAPTIDSTIRISQQLDSAKNISPSLTMQIC